MDVTVVDSMDELTVVNLVALKVSMMAESSVSKMDERKVEKKVATSVDSWDETKALTTVDSMDELTVVNLVALKVSKMVESSVWKMDGRKVEASVDWRALSTEYLLVMHLAALLDG